MTILPQTKRHRIHNLFGYVKDEMEAVNRDVNDEEINDPRFKESYLSTRDASEKTHLQNIVKGVLWLAKDQGIKGNIAAFTDAEIDALPGQIRMSDKDEMVSD